MRNCFTMDGNVKEISNNEPDSVTRLRNARHFKKKLQNYCLAFQSSPVMCGWVWAEQPYWKRKNTNLMLEDEV